LWEQERLKVSKAEAMAELEWKEVSRKKAAGWQVLQ
jgi:hypothetical protein